METQTPKEEVVINGVSYPTDQESLASAERDFHATLPGNEHLI